MRSAEHEDEESSFMRRYAGVSGSRRAGISFQSWLLEVDEGMSRSAQDQLSKHCQHATAHKSAPCSMTTLRTRTSPDCASAHAACSSSDTCAQAGKRREPTCQHDAPFCLVRAMRPTDIPDCVDMLER